MSYSIKQPSIAGRIGKGFGQGLAEQVPKEIERERLSSGLRKLGEKKFDPKNQFKNLADIYSIPGLAENPQLAEMVQNQIAKQNFQNRFEPEPTGEGQGGLRLPSPNQGIPENIAAQNIPQENVNPKIKTKAPAEKNEGFATQDEIASYKKKLLQVPTYEEQYKLANKYLDQGITQNPEAAMKLADLELRQNLTSQKTKNDTLRTSLNDRLARELQGTGLNDYKDISGEVIQKLIDQGEYLVNQKNKTPEEVTEELSKIALNLGKTTTNLKETGSMSNLFRASSKKASDLREQKKDFEKYGFGEIFDDLATAAMGTTPLEIAHVLDPIKNKELEKKLKDLKKSTNWGSAFFESNKKLKENQLDGLIESIGKDDNLFSIEYELRARGYDVQQFKDRVSALEDEKKKVLSPRQKRQQKRPVDNSFFGDILFESF